MFFFFFFFFNEIHLLLRNERDIMSAYENTMTLLPYNENMET